MVRKELFCRTFGTSRPWRLALVALATIPPFNSALFSCHEQELPVGCKLSDGPTSCKTEGAFKPRMGQVKIHKWTEFLAEPLHPQQVLNVAGPGLQVIFGSAEHYQTTCYPRTCCLGRPLGYLTFSLMALIRDPIYQYFSMGFRGPTQTLNPKPNITLILPQHNPKIAPMGPFFGGGSWLAQRCCSAASFSPAPGPGCSSE